MVAADNEANRAEGALILHLILQYYGEVLDKEQVQLIYKSTLNALLANPKKAPYRVK